MFTLLYFASVKETLALDQEQIAAENIATVGDLVALLSQRGGAWSETLTRDKILVAVNQTISDFDTPLQRGDEVAFFPPVTGG